MIYTSVFFTLLNAQLSDTDPDYVSKTPEHNVNMVKINLLSVFIHASCFGYLKNVQ